jgi:hypothetical protein
MQPSTIDTTNPRVRVQGRDYEVRVGDRWYLVEEDDRDQPPTWKAYTDNQTPGGGVRVGLSDDPLSGVEAACAAYPSAEALIDVLLAVKVPA